MLSPEKERRNQDMTFLHRVCVCVREREREKERGEREREFLVNAGGFIKLQSED